MRWCCISGYHKKAELLALPRRLRNNHETLVRQSEGFKRWVCSGTTASFDGGPRHLPGAGRGRHTSVVRASMALRRDTREGVTARSPNPNTLNPEPETEPEPEPEAESESEPEPEPEPKTEPEPEPTLIPNPLGNPTP